jgi:ATP-binding cassette subfamily B protein
MVIVGPACVWLYGGWLCIYKGLTIGIVVSFIALLGRLYAPAATLAGVQNQIISALAVFERIFDYLDMEVERVEARAEDPQQAMTVVSGQVRFQSVSFAYPERELALDSITFEVAPGQVAAFVGPSGAGKTTVSMLLPGFYQPTAGDIYIDDLNVQEIPLATLRSHIGIVTQETYLFHDTIMNNLRYAKPDASDEEVYRATGAANIHEMIIGLEQGYDTVVGERGHKLSGGERQRLAIARVLLKDPKILILDEATSSLDSGNEALIQKALVPLMKNRTSLVIAHRLSTVLSADLIFVMDGGCIVESGTHAELIDRGGLYRSLYDKQFLH